MIKILEDLRRPLMLLCFSRILLITLLTTNAVSAHAQNASEPSFHKFAPKIAPEQAAAGPQTAGPAGMSVAAAQQIAALEQEKDARTPAQRKIDSNVLYTLRMLQGKPAAPGVSYLYTGIDLDDKNNIVVDITAYVTDQLLRQLDDAGAKVLLANQELRSIRAVIPPDQIEAIAASPDVIFISPKQDAITQRARQYPARDDVSGPLEVAPGFAQRAERVRAQLATALSEIGSNTAGTVNTGQGSVTTEGDLTHRAYDARGTFLTNGSGLKIGVLSDGVSSRAMSQATGDLPADCGGGASPCLTVLPGQVGSGDEGTAMLEIIYDMAPGANLYFATADPTITNFAQNIRNLRAAGCDIIVDDVFYFVETPFQDGQTSSVLSTTNGGVVTQAVNDVVASGALYFSSAGNEGNKDDNTSGTFEGDFAGVASVPPLPAGSVHNFGPNPYDTIGAPGFAIDLFWSDPLGGSSNDYDLYVLNSIGTIVVASSTNIQNGTQDPFEQVFGGITPGNRLVIFQKTGASNRFFHVGNLRGTLAVNTAGETHGHSAASGAYTVAATPAAGAFGPGYPTGPFPNPFNSTNLVELFTSDGLRHIFFNADSTPITPGNFSSTGGAVLNKPDITGADGVSVTGVGGFGSPFYGTSAAAPSAAAVAALVKSAQPSLTQAQIRTALTSTAIDIMAPGFDRDSGFGIVMAWEAVHSLGVPGFANPQLGTITATENPGNGNGVIEAGEGAKLMIQLKNTSGLLAATGITATLTTSTPSVTITLPNTSGYPDLPAGTGTGNNLSPFTFTLASNTPCALLINFTLTVTYTGGPTRMLNFGVQTGMVNFNNNLGTTPTAFPGVITATGTQTNRVTRSGVPSTCGTTKVYPGTITAGPRAFDSYTFTACRAACLKSTVTGANAISLFDVNYSPSFVPANIATNYVGDAGVSGSGQICAINTNPATSYTLVVSDVPGTSVGTNYNLQFPICTFNCSVNQVPVAIAHDVTVVAPTVGGTAPANVDNGSFDPDGDPLTITQIPPGPYPVGHTNVLLTVVDPAGATSQASARVTVLNPSSTAVVSSLNPSAFSNPVTFTATTTPASGPTGTVTFKDGTTVLGSGQLFGGTASFTTNALSIGVHNITAVYSGDGTFVGSTSPILVQTVTGVTAGPADIGVTVTHSPNNPNAVVAIGAPLTFTITVTHHTTLTTAHVVLNLSAVAGPSNPVSLTSTPGTTCAFGSSAIQCDIPALAPGASETVTLVLQPLFSDVRTFMGIASISTNTTDSGAFPHYATDTVNLRPRPRGIRE